MTHNLTNNPDAYAGLGATALRDMFREHDGNNETPLHVLERVASPVKVQTIVARYWARMAYLDIGHEQAREAFLSSRGSLNFSNPDSLGNQTYKPDDYYAFDVRGSEVAQRRTGVRPEHADLVFTYRPLNELELALETANAVGARTIWFQNDGSADQAAIARAGAQVNAAGFAWISEPTILDAARSLAKPA